MRSLADEVGLPGGDRPRAGLLGGIVALVVRKVKAGEGEKLTELVPDLLELFLAPYYGREEAVRIARSAS